MRQITAKINSIFKHVIYRYAAGMDCSSGSVSIIHDDELDSEIIKLGSGEGSINGETNQRNLLFKKSLTQGDAYFERLMIALESAKHFHRPPKKFEGTYEPLFVLVLDQKGFLGDRC